MFKIGDEVYLNYDRYVNTPGTVISLTDRNTIGYPVVIRLQNKETVRLSSEFKMWKKDDKPCITLAEPVVFEL